MTHLRASAAVGVLAFLLGAGSALAQSPQAQAPVVAPLVLTAPTAEGGANGVALIRNPVAPEKSLVAATGEGGGLELYGLDGKKVGAIAGGEVYGVDVREQNGKPLLALLDRKGGRLRLAAYDFATGQATSLDAKPLALGYAGEGVCLHRGARDGALYAFTLGVAGQMDQWLLFPTADGKLDGRIVRRLHLSSEAKYCVSDDATGSLYVAQEAVGIWRYDADPEAEPAPTLIDAARLGQIAGEVAGLALVDGGANARFLVAANASAGDYLVYDRARDDAYVGAFRIQAGDQNAVENPSGLFALRNPLSDRLPAGTLLVADDRKSGADMKVVSWADIAAGLKLATGDAAGSKPAAGFATVRPTMETQPVDHDGDAADDPAIWANPADPAKSAIIATDKKGGLLVYDLDGKPLQHLADGKMNNVDLRSGFRLGGRETVLVTASDRTHKSIAIYTLDPATRQLTSVADGVQATGLSDPYGLCMYRGRKGETYVFIGDPDGLVRQWKLVAQANGKVRAAPVRDLKFDSQTEGCLADDETGALYVAEEDVALWRLGAEPTDRKAPKAVDRVAANPALKDDLEGVGLYRQAGGKGYLVVSSQGNNSYAVYRREGDNAYVGSFSVTADGARGIDGISETDGLDVTSASLGTGLETGAFVAQDGRNVFPPEHQNFKLVPWSSIAGALGLQ
ncbi:3-phytase [Caulobacter vibrioides]|nr:3-phytase [Caulobacter vibrioides]